MVGLHPESCVIRMCHQNLKSSSTEWWLDQLYYRGIVLTRQYISHSENEKGRDKDIEMNV